MQETVEGFEHLIPDNWKDDQFRKEIDEARTTTRVDVRPIVTGSVRMSEETSKQLGIPAFVVEESVDYYKTFQAIINLLERKGMVSKVSRVEKVLGEEWDAIE